VTQPAPIRRRPLATSPFNRPDVRPPTTSGFSVGDRVTYDRFGMGRVVSVDASFVTVDFGGGDVRDFAAGTSGLQPL
jgi:hypothetical protein